MAWFDVTVNEECLPYGECGVMRPVIARDKPALSIEYGPLRQTANKVYPRATPLMFSTLTKRLGLRGPRHLPGATGAVGGGVWAVVQAASKAG